MKANPTVRACAAIAFAAGLLTISACSQQQVAPSPVPTPSQPRPEPAPPPPPPPPIAQPRGDWRDAPITPGDWRWAMEGQLSVARFGGNALVLSCDRAAGMVTLMRPGTAQGPVPMTVVTSNQSRPLTGMAIATNPPVIAATLTVRDGLLDAMAFSRGRFVVETAGLPTLYVPSWPEVSRVIEDCR